MSREQTAVRRASGQRLLADFTLAAEMVHEARRSEAAATFILGAISAPISLSLRACLETAFGR